MTKPQRYLFFAEFYGVFKQSLFAEVHALAVGRHEKIGVRNGRIRNA